MKILAFVDYHNEKEHLVELRRKAKKANLILCAGDPTFFGNNMHEILAEFNSWSTPMLITHGNHEDPREMYLATKRHNNIQFHHKTYQIIDNIAYLFWGGGGFTNQDPDLDHKLKTWVKIKEQKILITHAPPHGTKLDKKRYHVGCKTITKAIHVLKPLCAISGHIHETAEVIDKLNNTILINPGPKGKLIRL